MYRMKLFALLFAIAGCSFQVAAVQAQEKISIDAGGATTPFPHFWEQTFGSGRGHSFVAGQLPE